MKKLFNNILVPVIAGNANQSTVEKSVEFANQLQCNVHLVTVDPSPVIQLFETTWLSKQTRELRSAEHQHRLSQLQASYSAQLEKGLTLTTQVAKGKPEEILSSYISLHQIDLVLVDGERNGFPFLKGSINASRLAGQCNCPVLYLQSNLALSDLKIIVMPVGRSLPINKIRVAAYLAKLYCASIHLVTREKNGLMYEELAYMQKALQVLKDNTDLPVKCKTFSGESLGDIALQYSREVDAGLILINPRQESFLSGIVNRMFSRFVFNESKIPVMMVV